METKSRPIIILGMDRSGTSLVASLISQWGAYGGDTEQLQLGDIHNPKGFYENDSLVVFLEELFREIKIGFWSPDFDQRLLEQAQNPQMREKAAQLVKKMNQQSPIWFWKEPYMSVMLDFWNDFLDDPIYIIPLRNPYDSALSWQKFTLPEELQGAFSLIAVNLLRWQHMLRSVMIGTNHARHRRLFVPYEALLQSPREQCQRLSDFLDQQLEITDPPAGRVEHMAQQIDPELHRNKTPVPFSEVPEATPEQKAFYEFLLGAVDNPQVEFDAQDFPMYAGWREYTENITQFTIMYHQARRNSLSGRVAYTLGRISHRIRPLLDLFRRR